MSIDWSDDPAFWQAMEPALCAPGRLAVAEGDVAAILEGVVLPSGARVLENARVGLVPGGALLADLVGREAAARQWLERRWHEVDGVLYLERCTPVQDWSSLVSDWIVVRDGARRDFRVRQRLYSATELRELLLSVGFASVRLAGSLDGRTPYDESARRLVAVARLPTGA